MSDNTSALLRGPGQGRQVGHVTMKGTASELGGDYSVMEVTIAAHALLVPHKHDDADQMVVVLTGELVFEVGEDVLEQFTAGAGSYVLKPRGIPHGFWNPTDETVTYIELSGGETFQGYVDAAVGKGMVAAQKEARKYGITWYGDRVPRLMLENRLTRISGLDAPWEELRKLSPGQLIEALQSVAAAG